jgi:hypothetical protein
MLEFGQVREDQQAIQVREEEAPAPSTGTSTSKSKGENRQGPKRRRRKHERHKVDRSEEVHEILEVGSMGEPKKPTRVLAVFSNQVAVITRDKVEITWENWNAVSKVYKELVWTVVQKKFNYPMDADLDKCRNWVLHMAGSSLWNFKSMLTRDWLKWGKNPCSKYTMIKDHQWEAFKKMRLTEEVKEKSTKYSALVKMN